MKLTQGIFMVVHILSVIAMVLLLLRQAGKSVKQIPKGFTHASLTALVAGFVMVAIHPSLHKHYPAQYGVLNMGTIAVKLVFLIVILVIAFRNQKKESITTAQWWTLLGLIVINIGLASSLK
jgi:cytochrome bd-type quinol oxidase subunit 2